MAETRISPPGAIEEAANAVAGAAGLMEDAARRQDSKDELGWGLQMLNHYQALMLAVEKNMHPDYRANLKKFREENGL